jgi:hypothetical protein
MEPSLIPLLEIFKLHTWLFVNSLDKVNDSTFVKRIKKTNSLAFIAIHLLDARYYLANYVGHKVENPFKPLFEDAENIDDIKRFPKVSEVKKVWLEFPPILIDRLKKLKEDELAKKSFVVFPVDDHSILGGITFLIDHESYHIGQLGFLRRCLGLPPMSYCRKKKRS